MLCESVSRGLSRCCLQVVQVAVLLLIIGEALTHVVQDIAGETLCALIGEISAKPVGVQTDFIHTDQSDGREVVIKCSEISLCVRIQPLFEQLGDDRALRLQAAGSEIHQDVESVVEILFILCEVCDSRHVDRYNADGTCRFAGAEETAGFLSELAEIEAETAAHRAHVARLHIGVDIVGEVRCAVLGGHLEQQTVILGVTPVEVAGDGIGRNRILESASVVVAFNHDFNEGLVDHIHFFLAVAVCEIHMTSAHDG